MASEVIKLNLIPSGEMPTFHCSQFDNGREILIDLFNGEDEYSLPEGYTAELHTRKMDNNIVTLATTAVSSNHLTFTSTEQLTACAGNNLSEVSIKDASDYVVGTLNFWLYVEKDPLQGGLTSTSSIHDLTDQIEEITTEIVGENYYNKTETDDLLDLKADKNTTYTITEVNTLLNSKADVSSVYTKSETNTLLSAKADASDVYTKSQVETKLEAKADADSVYTKSETDTLLSAKADANGVYNKVEVDAIVDDLEDSIDLKADQNTTYTKTEVDTALGLKADAATTYTKTEVDSALALKANAADVYTKTEVDNIILDIMPVDNASGAIASFNTALTADLVDCTSYIVASQESGTPAPDNPLPITGYTGVNLTVCGVNLWDEEWEVGTIDIYSGQDVPGSSNIRSKGYIPCTPNTTYLFNRGSFAGNVFEYDGNKSFVQLDGGATTFTTLANTHYLRFYMGSAYGTTYNNDISINYPATDTTYHAYMGTVYPVSWQTEAGTVYGGNLDLTTGVLTVTHKSISMDGTQTPSASSANRFYYTIDEAKVVDASNQSTYEGVRSECLGYTTWAGLQGADGDLKCSPVYGKGIAFRDDTKTSASDWVTFFTNNPTRFTYELATPVTYNLTPVAVAALLGTNNIYNDTNGNTAVKYKDSIQHYIDSHTGG